MYLLLFFSFIIISISIIVIKYYNYKYSLEKKIYYEKDCVDRNSECSKEITRRFNIYAEDLDDFDISGETLNMMKIKILPDPGNKIAKFHFYAK